MTDATLHEVDRRAFLRIGVAAGAGALAAACGWDGGNLVRPGLWSISRVNDWVGEKLLYSPTRLARTYPSSEPRGRVRSEEHTSELQSLTNLVCRLLLEKKK